MTYKIAIEGGQGSGEYALVLRELNPPANDTFADAQVLGSGPTLSIDGTNVDASAEPGEPGNPNAGIVARSSVWYRWTPAADGEASADVCSAAGNPRVSVHTGASVDSLTKIADSVYGCDATFDATAGTEYKISVDGDEGPFTLAIEGPGQPAPPPGPGGGQQGNTAPVATGKRAAALKKCKKRKGDARKKCIKKAKKLPA